MRTLYRGNRVLTLTGWFHWMLAAVLLLIYPFDSRTILGISPWIKPIKFSVSIAIYVWTLAWFLRYLADRARAVRIISWGVAISMAAEISCIVMQSARGVTSHFNVATRFDGAVFTLMGLMIVLNTVLVLWTLVLFCTSELPITAAYAWGIGCGLLLFLLAGVEGGMMISHRAHTVGAPDGGAGLPLVNWSGEHGDLRAAHFLGMHALQILPLAGYLAGRSRTGGSAQVRYVLGFAFLYLAATLALTWMALQGRPLVAL
ncbi:MAG TPA: hypothetical protein VIX89_07920 [Bryobacteraceae bacterium]